MFNNFYISSKMESVILFIVMSMMIPFAVLNYLNIYIWNVSFNPVDFFLKPFILIPAASLFLALLTEWVIIAFNYMKRLSLKIHRRNGRFSLKLVERSLPIQVIDQNYLKEFNIESGTIVDMRLKDRDPLNIGNEVKVVKLFHPNQEPGISHLIEKANILIQTSTFKNKPIIFIVDSKKDRNRTISRIWLKLILNPTSKSAQSDILTIEKLVY